MMCSWFRSLAAGAVFLPSPPLGRGVGGVRGWESLGQAGSFYQGAHSPHPQPLSPLGRGEEDDLQSRLRLRRLPWCPKDLRVVGRSPGARGDANPDLGVTAIKDIRP